MIKYKKVILLSSILFIMTCVPVKDNSNIEGIECYKESKLSFFDPYEVDYKDGSIKVTSMKNGLESLKTCLQYMKHLKKLDISN